MSAPNVAVRERGILFSGPMVRAIIHGRKTQTRRVVKPQPEPCAYEPGKHAIAGQVIEDNPAIMGQCPYGAVGDRLWVRETWAVGACADGLSPKMLDPRTWRVENGGIWYDATDGLTPRHPISPRGDWRVSIHMPRWASRLTLEITGVRVERLQAITNEDAIAEGCRGGPEIDGYSESNPADPYEEYAILWDALNAKRGYSWNSNPWVWVLSFRTVEP